MLCKVPSDKLFSTNLSSPARIQHLSLVTVHVFGCENDARCCSLCILRSMDAISCKSVFPLPSKSLPITPSTSALKHVDLVYNRYSTFFLK